MDWNCHATDTEIAGCITRLLDDERIQLLMGEDADLVELRANAVAVRAHAVGETCRARAAWDAGEVLRLQAEQ